MVSSARNLVFCGCRVARSNSPLISLIDAGLLGAGSPPNPGNKLDETRIAAKPKLLALTTTNPD